MTTHTRAADPNDLARLFVERANVGDVEGLVALYEPGAALAFPEGTVATELATGGMTVGIAHRHPDGYWLWAVDQPSS